MFSELLDVSFPCRCVRKDRVVLLWPLHTVCELDDVLVSRVRVNHVEEFKERSSPDVKLREIVRAKKPFVSCFTAQLFESGDSLLLERLCGFFTLADTPDRVEEFLDSIHLEAHLRCKEWISGHQVDSFASVLLNCKLCNHSALWDEFTSWKLHNWDHTTIKFLEPRRLVMSADQALLELDSFSRHCVSTTCSKWAQIVIVNTNMVFVGRRFWLLESSSGDSCQRLRVIGRVYHKMFLRFDYNFHSP